MVRKLPTICSFESAKERDIKLKKAMTSA